ncbi:MAG: hypothetical protein HW405_964 [Candidatus Berkelbacteria bacterium]|nr:hypothetical protein [Candidatus Berkelbacteria bacterium]
MPTELILKALSGLYPIIFGLIVLIMPLTILVVLPTIFLSCVWFWSMGFSVVATFWPRSAWANRWHVRQYSRLFRHKQYELRYFAVNRIMSLIALNPAITPKAVIFLQRARACEKDSRALNHLSLALAYLAR